MDCQSESGLGVLKTPKYEFKTRLFCYPTGDAGCFLVHVLHKVYFLYMYYLYRKYFY